MNKRKNPLFREPDNTLDVTKLRAPTVFLKRPSSTHRIITRLTRGEKAEQAIADWTPDLDCIGFTKAQFSLLELIAAVIDKIGPAHVTLSTWTAARTDLANIEAFLKAGRLLSIRFLLDYTFQRRTPDIAQHLRNLVGIDNLRLTRNHTKFALLKNDRHRITLQTSMNLNTNPRFENFELHPQADLFEFIETICTELFWTAPDQSEWKQSKNFENQFTNLK